MDVRRRCFAPNKIAYITSTETGYNTNNYLVTPILMPENSRIVVQGFLQALSTIPSDTYFLNWSTTNKSNLKKQSSDNKLIYNYYGNDAAIVLTTGNNNIVEVEFIPALSSVNLTLENGTIMTGVIPSFSFEIKTTPLRLYLKQYFQVSRIIWYDDDNYICSNLVPAIHNNAACLMDTVTGKFYHDTTGNAYIIYK